MSKINTDFVDQPEVITDSEWLIGVDCGHGGMIGKHYQTFPNKMYDHGDFVFYEGVFNREVGKRLANLLLQEKISYYFTATSNYDVSLPVRVMRANNMVTLHPDKKQLLLSIHGNAAPKGAESATGIEVFTTKGDTPADPMATIFFKHLKKMKWKMRQDVHDGDPDKEAMFFILRKTVVPAVLVELGFYTNLKQAQKMADPVVQDRFAKHLFNAIKEIIKPKEDVQA